MTIALCRAVGDTGRIVSYELREEHRDQAVQNLEGFFGKVPETLDLRLGDSRRRRPDGGAVRPVRPGSSRRPGSPSRRIATVLEPGGVLCAYLPTTVQIQQLVLALPAQGFLHIETFEVLRRGWHVTDRSVRPDHRMVGHTGFLTIARRTA